MCHLIFEFIATVKKQRINVSMDTKYKFITFFS